MTRTEAQMTELTKSRREQAEQMAKHTRDRQHPDDCNTSFYHGYTIGFLDSDKTREYEIKKCMELLERCVCFISESTPKESDEQEEGKELIDDYEKLKGGVE